MGCDWNTIAASDLFVLCHSSVDGAKTYEEGTPMSTSNPMVPGSIPGSGIRAPLRSDKIIRVGVYLSDFGAEKLEQERIHGPSFEELELIERRNAELKNNDGEISEATALAIRKYDRQRARYYYAVVECVDVHTAEELYSQLDGMDADFAVDGIDLRYVPDDLQKFPRQPESECTALPHNYVPPVTFDSSLKHTHAELHWDEPDPRRHQLLTKRHTEEEMNAIDLEQYLASTDTSDQEDDAERIREVRKLLLGNTAEPESDDSAKEGTFFISASGNPVRVDAGETEAEMSDREGENAKTKKRPAKERLTKEDSETRKKATRSKRSGFALLSGDPEQDADSESDEGIGDILLAHVSDGQDSSDSHSERKPKGRKSIRQRRKNALAQHRQKKRERDNTQYVESLVKKDERFGALFNDPAHFA
ncbi:putative pre-rRNA-processing protein ESF1 [Gregarina niphandrodes]|uniref:Pre-rRNA-processing protein ESF1 n=1 Tax=Gregarina niphandrodes TaxID=110365 RepID=A0A023B0X0_GRENI|nr:putative pre-rRNA-processing protein ESF1 [Gregarina niphandrodes]EZG44995.1 putative pre-rRNA-processing protein ESF1 [Gregarina niphandrodes]|eukprot:XP_011132603.1 putative pre-rRNA-processing protein ESF1 [Gregarina niphandrodes]